MNNKVELVVYRANDSDALQIDTIIYNGMFCSVINLDGDGGSALFYSKDNKIEYRPGQIDLDNYNEYERFNIEVSLDVRIRQKLELYYEFIEVCEPLRSLDISKENKIDDYGFTLTGRVMDRVSDKTYKIKLLQFLDEFVDDYYSYDYKLNDICCFKIDSDLLIGQMIELEIRIGIINGKLQTYITEHRLI